MSELKQESTFLQRQAVDMLCERATCRWSC